MRNTNSSVTKAEFENRFAGLEKAIAAEFVASEERMIAGMTAILAAAEQRMMRYFDVKVEQLTHDFRGIFSDRIEQLKDRELDHEARLQRIEQRLQLV